MSKVIEIAQREYDNKWLRWELMDSLKKGGIGQTSTWSRYKWVITEVYDMEPKEEISELILADEKYKLETRENGRPVYTFNLQYSSVRTVSNCGRTFYVSSIKGLSDD